MHPGGQEAGLADLRFWTVIKAPSGHLYGCYGVSGALAHDIQSREEGAEVGVSAGGGLLLTPGL